jgi:hypothetical protein
VSDDEIEAFADLIHDAAIQYANGRETDFRPVAQQIAEASRRASIKEAHSVCLAGVKWSPEPSKEAQFYVNGTCHRLAAEISQLAKETNNG